MSKEIEQAHQEVATRNAQAAVTLANSTKAALEMRLDHLEHLVTNLYQTVTTLEQKYNLLLTSRFNGGSTAE